MTSAITATGLRKSFGGKAVLDGIDLEVGAGTTLIHLGDTLDSAREPTQAQDAWQQALAMLEDLHHPDADKVRAKLVSTSHHTSQAPRR